MAALNVDKAGALAPHRDCDACARYALIEAIGPAPGFGRMRWQELTEKLEGEGGRARALAIVAAPDFTQRDTDARFEALMQRLRAEPAPRARPDVWVSQDGAHAARISRSGKKLTLVFDDRVAPRFGDFVRGRLQTLYAEYKAADSAT